MFYSYKNSNIISNILTDALTLARRPLMLEKIDLDKKFPKDKFKEIIPQMELKLGELQRIARDLKIPIMLVFEGWETAGKGTQINRLIMPLDPRGFSVFPVNPPTDEEKLRPFLWRFWVRTPAKGRIVIFEKSWYGRVLSDRVDDLVGRREWERAYDEIKAFERQLADDGTVIIKFFFHIDKKEQRKRFKKMEEDPATAWRISKEDWRHHKNYDKFLEAYDDMLAKTDTDYAPWHIIEAHDERFAQVKIFSTVTETLLNLFAKIEKNISAQKPAASVEKSTVTIEQLNSSILDKIDLSVALSKDEYIKTLNSLQKKVREIEHQIYIERMPVVILYEGWDAAGKGGNIKRLTETLDPRGYEVIPIAAPNDIEKSHHYLWRFWKAFPKAGHITIFDRTWYGRVLVERVEGFCGESDWKRAYKEINEMEEQFASFGSVVIKFWLQIDKDEQLRRFEERQRTPHKMWKITEEDWRNREKWDRYKEAIDEMLFRTSSSVAPWTIVESNNKYHARIKALKTVVESVADSLKNKKRKAGYK